jgi:release factor glutamine methyltransferase
MCEFGRSRILSAPSAGIALLPEQSHSLPAPPLRGSRIGEADPRGVRREPLETAASSLGPPSLPLTGGGESKRQGLKTLGEAFAAGARMLRQAKVETPELDARLLLCHATGLSHEAYVALRDDPLLPDAAARFGSFIERRLTGEPVSRILGVREFYGRPFRIDASTLDPRADTETLIEAALAIVDRKGLRQSPLKLLDLGSGSGCLLITLLAELPEASGVGIDVSVPALRLARSNAEALGVGARASFVAGDWLEGIDGAFDLVVANPPYIASGDIARLSREVNAHDPWAALDGGPDGLAAYRRIASRIRDILRPGGTILLETGAGQADAVLHLLAGAGLGVEAGHCLWCDLGQRPRVVAASA